MDFKLLLYSIIAITLVMMDVNSGEDSSFKMSAERKLEQLKFRAKMEADTILDEDWTDMESSFPYNFVIDGPPSSSRSVVLYIPLGMWDFPVFAKLVDNDDDVRFNRYTMSKIFEDGSRQAGFNSNQSDPPKFDIVVDLAGMNGMFEGLGLFKERRELVIQKVIKALAQLGKAFTFMYMEAVETVWFINVPLDQSTLSCYWESEDSFHCRKECHENEVESCELIIL